MMALWRTLSPPRVRSVSLNALRKTGVPFARYGLTRNVFNKPLAPAPVLDLQLGKLYKNCPPENQENLSIVGWGTTDHQPSKQLVLPCKTPGKSSWDLVAGFSSDCVFTQSVAIGRTPWISTTCSPICCYTHD